ncbi:MucBP domain-containing protein [Isobaculum melis]|uniref:MucBP domain-containing protein n=1 Tax=Isobaculum melis TaxID=142588 RepID=A0A1H9QE39_9LACT|nr:MucBP domain-containing protein [Isobaculum melis]SER58445.1 MucBP domain-containing protein [Isobaculum melis]
MSEKKSMIKRGLLSFITISAIWLLSAAAIKTQAETIEFEDQAEEQEDPASRAEKSSAVNFKVKRVAEQYQLEDLLIQENFGTIASVTIKMPKGLNLDATSFSLPTGWTTYNEPGSDVINYLLTQNNSPQIVQNTLQQLAFNIEKEELTKGKISISISEEDISAWTDPNGKTHYYKYVKNSLPWLEAYSAAKKERYKGLTGYLATITSPEEHTYIYESVAKDTGMLGGTRAVNKNGTKISDVASISPVLSNYNLSKDDWYWASGPEAGEVFFIGKKKPGMKPEDKYNGWTPTEPNNHGGSEAFLQFAQGGVKDWNDLENLGDTPNNRGYYVEFSEYGGQKEIEENSYSADVPQLVKVVYQDQQDKEKLAEEVIISKNFCIGDAYDTTSFRKEITDYELVGIPTENGNYKNEPITLIYTYKRKYLTLHIKQVVLNTSPDLVIPTKGYATLKNVDNENPTEVHSIYEEINLSLPSRLADQEEAGNYQVVKNKTNNFYQVILMLPEYYQNMGYVLTDVEAIHDVSQKQLGIPVMNSLEKSEYWLTLYIQPNSTSFRPYTWNYQLTGMN